MWKLLYELAVILLDVSVYFYIQWKSRNRCSDRYLDANTMEALFIIAKSWKQPKVPSASEGINKMCVCVCVCVWWNIIQP